jgi:hypothetical protein
MRLAIHTKSEDRRPGAEIRKKAEARNPKARARRNFVRNFNRLDKNLFRNSDFGFLSAFGDSDLGLQEQRFAACTERSRLLLIDVRTARRAPVSESCSHFYLSAGCISRDRFKSVSQKNDNKNLKRCEIYRGKIPPRQTQKLKHRLETRTHLRQKL